MYTARHYHVFEDVYIYVIEYKQAQEAQVSYMKTWPRHPGSPLLLYCLLSWGVLNSQLTWKRQSGWFTDGSAQHTCTTHTGQLQHSSPFSRKSAQWQSFRPRTGLSFLFGRSNSQMCDYVPLHGLWPMVWLDGQGHGGNMRKVVTKEFGQRYMDRLL